VGLSLVVEAVLAVASQLFVQMWVHDGSPWWWVERRSGRGGPERAGSPNGQQLVPCAQSQEERTMWHAVAAPAVEYVAFIVHLLGCRPAVMRDADPGQ
jgi:hypothetical protein